MSTLPDSATADSAAIGRMIAEVLRVPAESVHPDADLVYELGAESIDFLDLLFSLDELVGSRVLPERWGMWIRQRLPADSAGRGITPRVIEEFVVYYRASTVAQTPSGEAT